MASRSSARAKTPTSRVRAYVRIARLVLLFLAYIGPHFIAKTFTRRSPWPSRFLGAAARISGVRATVEGPPVGPHSLILANHTSWLDILVLAGATGTRFVSKAEVERIPFIGWLSSQNRTLYVDRAERGDAHGQVRQIAEALRDPQPIAIFPEGTTNNGRALLPFRSTLLHAVSPPPPGAIVRPVAVDYCDADDIAWFGGEPGMSNVMRVLGMRGTRQVTVRLLDPLPPSSSRKSLALEAAAAIAAALSSVAPHDALQAPAK